MNSSLWKYRRFIVVNALADLRHRYAGTGMGMFWNVLHPLALIAVYSIVFSQIMRTSLPGGSGKLAYTIYLCSGLFPWLAFSDCVSRGCGSFVSNANYLKKLPIPEQVFVAQSAVASMLSLSINFAMLLIVATLLGFHPRWHWFMLPIPLVLFQSLGFGIGLLLATLNVFFRDVGEWTNVVLQIAMWTVPIVYWVGFLPPRIQWLLKFHPLMPALVTTRALFLYGRLPDLGTWVAMVLWPALLVFLGGRLLHKLRPEIRDVI
jgi:homopolymeric O-antigen transport system permease protein